MGRNGKSRDVGDAVLAELARRGIELNKIEWSRGDLIVGASGGGAMSLFTEILERIVENDEIEIPSNDESGWIGLYAKTLIKMAPQSRPGYFERGDACYEGVCGLAKDAYSWFKYGQSVSNSLRYDYHHLKNDSIIRRAANVQIDAQREFDVGGEGGR